TLSISERIRNMITIHLHDVQLHAFHGIYEGEDKVGNPYVINLDVTYDERVSNFEELKHTIDYVDLFEIVKTRMQVPTGLLEKVCEGTIRRIRHQYPFVKEVTLSIYKLQAPIEHFQGKVGVSMNKKFND
ncbi:MAG: dihydroneopterin aldolase, partial [Flavitalea sp.]